MARVSFFWPPMTCCWIILMMKIECEREEVAFIAVLATARISFPWSISDLSVERGDTRVVGNGRGGLRRPPS